AGLGEGAGSGNQAAEGVGVGAVDGEGAVVEHVTQDRTARAAIAELQNAGSDRGAAGVAIRARQNSVPTPAFRRPPGPDRACPTVKTFAASAMSKPPPAGPQVMPRAVDWKLVPVIR